MTTALAAQSTITGISPNSGQQGASGLTVQISGTGFTQGTYTSVYFSQGSGTYGFSSTSVNINSANSITAVVDIPYYTATGVYDVMVEGYYTATAPSAFTVTQGAGPAITTVDTNYAAAGTTLDVAISGVNTHFASGTNTQVWFSQASGTYIYPNTVSVLDDLNLIANFTLDPAQDFGFYDVNVYDDQDNTLTLLNGFIVTDTSVGIITVSSSGYGTIGDSATLVITAAGTHFGAPGTTTTVWLGEAHRSMVPNIIAAGVTVISPTQLSVHFNFPHGSSSGFYDVFVLNTQDGELTKERAFDLEAATGINDISADQITIYPNPTRDVLTLQVSSTLVGSAYTLTDLTGRTVQSGTVSSRVSTLSLTGMSEGLYMLHVGSRSYKIVKD
jgi:hypothetical protein